MLYKCAVCPAMSPARMLIVASSIRRRRDARGRLKESWGCCARLLGIIKDKALIVGLAHMYVMGQNLLHDSLADER